MADNELKKAFQELHFRNSETKTVIAQGEANKKSYEQQKRMSELTSKALSEIPSNLNVYQSVGRMFVMSSKDDELKRYTEEGKKCSEKVEAIDKQREYLEKSLNDAEKNIRELVQNRRS